jgi:5-amino-6-(5-phosphoribosylamino)uracil reductase
VSSPERRAARTAQGKPAYPLKVTITAGGDLGPDLKFWHHGDAKIVYCPDNVINKVTERVGGYATVSGTGPSATVGLGTVLDDLGTRGVHKLMVEGGSRIHTQFLTAGLADEIQLAVAPFFVGQADAPRFVQPAAFPNDLHHRMALADVRAVGDVALLRYLPKPHTSPGADHRPDVAAGPREPRWSVNPG